MMLMILAAMTAAVPMQDDAQQKAVPTRPAQECAARRVLARNDIATFGWSDAAKAQAELVSKIVEPDKAAPKHRILPRETPPSKGPAVLQPGCRAPEEESTDYPMA